MPPLSEIVVVGLLLIGGVFCLLAAMGVLLMTDLYNRMQAASKAVTLGATAIVFAAAVHFGEAGVVARSLLVCVFFFVTVPVATHLIARAAYRAHEPLAPETRFDDLNRYSR